MSAIPINARNDLNNIPHMLRNLAQEFESGSEKMPITLLAVAVYEADDVPVLYHFGADNRMLTDSGALHLIARHMTQTMLESDR